LSADKTPQDAIVTAITRVRRSLSAIYPAGIVATNDMKTKIDPIRPAWLSLNPRSFWTSDRTPGRIPRSTESMNATSASRTTGVRP
jgi:hypothetical protein